MIVEYVVNFEELVESFIDEFSKHLSFGEAIEQVKGTDRVFSEFGNFPHFTGLHCIKKITIYPNSQHPDIFTLDLNGKRIAEVDTPTAAPLSITFTSVLLIQDSAINFVLSPLAATTLVAVETIEIGGGQVG
jgi:hypothetical protein